jgi:hypothetical protein
MITYIRYDYVDSIELKLIRNLSAWLQTRVRVPPSTVFRSGNGAVISISGNVVVTRFVLPVSSAPAAAIAAVVVVFGTFCSTACQPAFVNICDSAIIIYMRLVIYVVVVSNRGNYVNCFCRS